MIDTHCHLVWKDYEGETDLILNRARQLGMKAFVNIGTDPETNGRVLSLSEQHDDIWASLGLHPHEAHKYGLETIEEIGRLAASSPKVVAIGECGLDYYRSQAPADIQKRIFKALCALAARLDKALVVHSRDAFEDTLEILSQTKNQYPGLRAVFHCYSYDADCLKRAVAEGFYISFSGILTFPKTDSLKEAARICPDPLLLAETDAPYLAPVPLRGSRNEPAYMAHTLKVLAQLKGWSEDRAAEQTTRNAVELFRLKLALC